MSNRWFVVVFVTAAIWLGWFWRIATERDWPIAPLGYGLFLALCIWLYDRINRDGKGAA